MNGHRVTAVLTAVVFFTVVGAGVALAGAMDIWDGQTLSTQFADEQKLCKAGYCTGGVSVGHVV